MITQKKLSLSKVTLLFSLFLMSQFAFSIERTATTANTNQIKNWAKDGVTTKITFPDGIYLFSTPLVIENDDLILEGTSKDNTILRLTADKGVFINALGNNANLSDLTIDGDLKQTGWGNSLFRFQKSKGHSFNNVKFTNLGTTQFGINSNSGWATDGLELIDCEFVNIQFFCLQIFNRNTNKRGEVITSVDKITIDGCVFREGYHNAISSDNGNDRQDDGTKDVDGKIIGRRYTESTSLSGTVIQNCIFEKSKQFHIALVQTQDVIIQNNDFQGMTDNAGGGSQPIHVEQLSRNIEIYNNTFSMATTVPKSYSCIHFRGTEGHIRAVQQQPSNTYAQWLYFVYGSNERRANTSCAKSGHTDKSCKRDVHFYGVRNLYIAGNTFNASSKFSDYIFVNEGENIQIGIKKDGTVALNDFQDGIGGDHKIKFSGNDEGTCDVKIVTGQKIVSGDIKTDGVSFDLPQCSDASPVEFVSPESLSTDDIINLNSKPLITPNPVSDNFINLNTDATNYNIYIYNLTGKKVKTSNQVSNNSLYIGDLSSGVYILNLHTKNERKLEKLIIL